MPDESILQVRLVAASLDALRDFIRDTQPDLGCRPVAKRHGDGFVTDVYLPEPRLQAARALRSAAAVEISVIDNITESGRARQAEVGKGNRFAARGSVPRGLGRKEPRG